ncbi:peptidoglycan-binding domain-containing protein [Vogesella sp. LIG4]|uniref:peptidoglycan-binding domain-containing protein n=1 Tax=Vogesella sp. LIG4 TaxID=1192162 RepID=UPI0012FE4B98|nr:peptidoglycan-binding domain-containing protein [Vogesella sp. LIG4]
MGSKNLEDLEPEFQKSLRNFIEALKEAGAVVRVAATYRPPERAWLMHWSHLLSRGEVNASKIPAKLGVGIQWGHGEESKSIAAAKEMAEIFEISHLGTSPAIISRHTQRKAVDMNVSWSGSLVVCDATGNSITIDTEPKTGMSEKLHAVGKSYGVIKFWKGAKDKPHWSVDRR